MDERGRWVSEAPRGLREGCESSAREGAMWRAGSRAECSGPGPIELQEGAAAAQAGSRGQLSRPHALTLPWLAG